MSSQLSFIVGGDLFVPHRSHVGNDSSWTSQMNELGLKGRLAGPVVILCAFLSIKGVFLGRGVFVDVESGCEGRRSKLVLLVLSREGNWMVRGMKGRAHCLFILWTCSVLYFARVFFNRLLKKQTKLVTSRVHKVKKEETDCSYNWFCLLWCPRSLHLPRLSGTLSYQPLFNQVPQKPRWCRLLKCALHLGKGESQWEFGERFLTELMSLPYSWLN